MRIKKNRLITFALVGLLVLAAAGPAFGMMSGSGAGSGAGFSSGTPSGVGQASPAISSLNYSGQLSQMMQSIQANPGTMSNYAAAGQLMEQLGQTGMKVFADGQQVDFSTYGVQPVIQDGRTLVPVRSMVDALGAQVSWDPSTQTVTVNSAAGTIQMTVGSDTMLVNGRPVTLDVPPSILNSRTMLPLRAMAEAMGMNVNWLSQEDMVVMTSGTGGTTPSVNMSVYQGVYQEIYGE